MFKKHDIISLPTTDKKYGISLAAYSFICQHLYVLSDEKISGKGFRVDLKRMSIGVIDDDHYYNNPKNGKFKKVISSTDPSLGLPLISNLFINEFVVASDSQNHINTVDVEYDFDYSAIPDQVTEFLKINPNNTISIKSKKEHWNKNEVIALCEKIWFSYGKLSTESSFDQWVNDNI